MFCSNLYHGTESKNSDKILLEKCFMPSEGDKHWLGDGIYFYDDNFLAYRWLWLKYYKKSPKSNEELFENYTILEAKVRCEQSKVYDLRKFKYRKDYEKIKKMILEKVKGKKILNDGTILNMMFNEKRFGYKDSYDVIVGIFSQKNIDLQWGEMLSDFEIQYCMKNNRCIVNIVEDEKSNYEDYYIKMKEIYSKREK